MQLAMTKQMKTEIIKVPDFRELFIPILREIELDSILLKELRSRIAEMFGISKKDQMVPIPAGSRNTFRANFDIAYSFLKTRALVTQERQPRPNNPNKFDAVVSITPEGETVLSSGEIWGASNETQKAQSCQKTEYSIIAKNEC